MSRACRDTWSASPNRDHRGLRWRPADVLGNLVLFRQSQLAPGGRDQVLSESQTSCAAEDHLLELDPGELDLRMLAELELVFDVVWRRQIAAQNVEAQLLTVVAAHQTDKQALQPLL